MEPQQVREGMRVELLVPDPRIGSGSAHLQGRIVRGQGMSVYYKVTPGGWKPKERLGKPYVTVQFEGMVTYHPEPLEHLRAV